MIRKVPIRKSFNGKRYYFVTEVKTEAFAKHTKKQLQDKGYSVKIVVLNKNKKNSVYTIWARKNKN